MIVHKAIGCTLCVISVFLLIAALANSEWAKSEGWREGLFLQCVDKGSATPIPFRQPNWMGNSSECHPRLLTNQTTYKEILDEDGNPIEDKPGYIKATIALVIIGLLLTLAGSFLTGFGLKTEDVEKQKKFNLYSIAIFAIAFLFLLISSIVYPVNFTADQQAANVTYDGCMLVEVKRKCGKKVTPNPLDPMADTNNDTIPDAWQERGWHQTPREFSFGFCFGVLVLSVIFIFIAIILLVLDHFKPQPPKEDTQE